MTKRTADVGERVEDVEEGHVYKWEVEPHPYSSDYDVFVTDDDVAAIKALQDAAETVWDDMSPGEEKTLTIRMNKP